MERPFGDPFYLVNGGMLLGDSTAANSEFQHHRPYRPWQVHPGRPDLGADPVGVFAGYVRPAFGQHGPGTGAGDHHQGPWGNVGLPR